MYSHGNTDLKGKGTHAVITLAEDLVVAVPVGYIITQCDIMKPYIIFHRSPFVPLARSRSSAT